MTRGKEVSRWATTAADGEGAARENINIIFSHILKRFSPLVSSVGLGHHLIRVQAGNVMSRRPPSIITLGCQVSLAPPHPHLT